MEHKGIVRRIDDLGRIVIPREIRITLGIKEGDPLIISSDWKKGTITLEKHIPDNSFKFTDDELKHIEFEVFDRMAAISRNVDYFKSIDKKQDEEECRKGLKTCESILNQIEEIKKGRDV